MPQPSLRKHISDLRIAHGNAQHAGLWLDRMLPEQLNESEKPSENGHPHTKLIKQAHTIEPSEYKLFVGRWERTLTSVGAIQRKAVVRGRIAVGLGNESILENSIAIHRTYGVPYIPGSALKGLATAYAHRFLADDTWRKETHNKKGEIISKIGDGHKIMFGDTTNASYVTFFDALYEPNSGHIDEKGVHRALWPDVITVHHPDYYQEKKQGEKPNEQLIPPADWDSPTPISFVSATGTYLIALAGPVAWVAAAFDILALALDEMGVGGKTSSGYGRMTLEGLEEAKQRWKNATNREANDSSKETAIEDPEQQSVVLLISQIQALPSARVATEMNRFYQQWKNATVREQLRQQIAQTIIEKVREAKREAQSSNKAWYQEVLASSQQSNQE